MTGGYNCTRVFIGWGDSGTRTVTNCLYIMQAGQNTSNFDLVKDGGTLTMTNCYKTTAAGSQGTLVYTVAALLQDHSCRLAGYAGLYRRCRQRNLQTSNGC